MRESVCFYNGHCTGTVRALYGHCTGTARALHGAQRSENAPSCTSQVVRDRAYVTPMLGSLRVLHTLVRASLLLPACSIVHFASDARQCVRHSHARFYARTANHRARIFAISAYVNIHTGVYAHYFFTLNSSISDSGASEKKRPLFSRARFPHPPP